MCRSLLAEDFFFAGGQFRTVLLCRKCILYFDNSGLAHILHERIRNHQGRLPENPPRQKDVDEVKLMLYGRAA